MRIGFLCVVDPDDATALSGMPFHMKRALEERGHRVTPICPPSARVASRLRALRSRAAGLLPAPIKAALRGLRPGLDRVRGARDPDAGLAEEVYARRIELATQRSVRLARRIDPAAHDLLFGCCISVPLYRLETPLPIVYYSDTTARLINASYPRYRDKPSGYHRAMDEIERTAMSRAAAVVTATAVARRSAIEHYGVPPERTHVVHMAANVEPGSVQWSPPEPPTRESLKLVITAADPVRKQLDLVVEAVELLRAEGIAAELSAIGSPTPKAEASPWVRCAGYLRLSDPVGRRRNLELLAASHLMVLPSLGEAFGIAPCEAASVGRPSIVSDAGGLPEAVLDDETGVVLPVSATAADYAAALRALVDDPARYRRLSAAATERARVVFRWSYWAERMETIFTDILAQPAGAP